MYNLGLRDRHEIAAIQVGPCNGSVEVTTLLTSDVFKIFYKKYCHPKVTGA